MSDKIGTSNERKHATSGVELEQRELDDRDLDAASGGGKWYVPGNASAGAYTLANRAAQPPDGVADPIGRFANVVDPASGPKLEQK